MAQAKLVISGPSEMKEMVIGSEGVTLGRGGDCDIYLESERVSRKHARISQDPFGRWIIEDLDSRNGVVIDGQRVKAGAICAGQNVEIGNFQLSLSTLADAPTQQSCNVRGMIPVVDAFTEDEIVAYRAEKAQELPPDLMKRLNEMAGSLMTLSSPSQLYGQACSILAGILHALVAVVRVPGKDRPLPPSPDVIACHFGQRGNLTSPDASQLYLSRRVLDAVRSSDVPIRAGGEDKQVQLTVVDKTDPHLVFAACINNVQDAIDVLYFDILERQSPKEMFDFVEAAARQINFVQKNLFLIELRKQEQALREANALLKEKDRIKDEYVSRVTHDIRGHLTAILSCQEIVADPAMGELNDTQNDFISRSLRRTEGVIQFVNELLNLTRMRLSGKIESAPFSLRDTLQATVEDARDKAREKSIAVTANIDGAIGEMVGNQFSISEMITNLLFNAVKYTPEGQTVHLDAVWEDGRVRIDISDTGIGIPAEDLEHLFDEFFRASNARNSQIEGTGLGLSIVKQIVEGHGGSISAKSTLGQGSTFTVTLPVGGSVVH